MGNIIGESIPFYVGEQIKKRQEIYGSGVGDNTRTIEEITYLNSRTGWIKLASGTSMDKKRLELLKKNGNTLGGDIPGKSLAQNNVLFGGLSRLEGNTLKQRQGISGRDKAYGLGGTDFGFAPMPGIIDANIKYLNRGSLKKATINIKAHNKNQLDLIDVLYMRLGYTVLLEWGNDKYINNNGDYTPMGPTLIESRWFNDRKLPKAYPEWLKLIEEKREETSGNYDAMYGVISNFSWTFESDGSYSVKIEIMSMGDVIESLKVNVPTSPYSFIENTSFEGYVKTQQGQDLYNSFAIEGQLDREQFIKKFGKKKNGELTSPADIDADLANKNDYYPINEIQFQTKVNQYFSARKLVATITPNLLKIKEELNPYYDFSKHPETTRDERYNNDFDPQNIRGYVIATSQGIVQKTLSLNSGNNYWFFKFDSQLIYNLILQNKGESLKITSDPKSLNYEAGKNEFLEKRRKQIQARTTSVENQIKILRESKLSYLFFNIREQGTNLIKRKPGYGGHYVPIENKEVNDNKWTPIGVILSKNEKVRDELEKLGVQFSYPIEGKDYKDIKEFSDIISLTSTSFGEKGQAAYYIRFGKLLEYISKHIIPKIAVNDGIDPPILGIDTNPETNIMYTLPNQLSTQPQTCIIKNSIPFMVIVTLKQPHYKNNFLVVKMVVEALDYRNM